MTGTDRLKCNPVLGTPPVLQWATPGQLMIDPSYQRSIQNGPSQSLIRQIAAHWNWDLCQPLVVSKRDGGGLFVIDGQHRLAAAKLRRDIAHLPCVILDLADRADEAANFVHLNLRRRSLSKLDVFKAAVASGDSEASAIARAMDEVGLSIATTTNPTGWKPGMVSNIGGIQQAWKRHGATRGRASLHILANGFAGQVLRYAGTIFPGIVALVAELTARRDPLIWKDGEQALMLIEMLAETPQNEWRETVLLEMAANPNLKFAEASARAIAAAWSELQQALAGDDEDDSEARAFDRARRGDLGALAQAEG
jgi:hypothetical protein